MKKYLTISLILFFSMNPKAFSTEIIHYENLPVTIELIVGQERSIQFSDHVAVGMTKGQQSKNLFRVQSAQGAIHILPHEKFDKQRIQIKRSSDGRVLLLDLIAKGADESQKELEDVRIYMNNENSLAVEAASEVTDDQSATQAPEITPIDLTRYASQRLYGPSRLHNDVRGINETSIGVKGAIRIFKGDNKLKTYAEAIVGYYGGGLYLAAIHIRNLSHAPVTLDYLDLNLPFSYATFQHHTLREGGTPGDSTVLYLISEKPLSESLYPWTYYQDIEAETKGSKSSKKRD